jgi:hypothetical protein
MNYAIKILFQYRREIKTLITAFEKDKDFNEENTKYNADYMVLKKYLFDIESSIRYLLSRPNSISPAFEYITRKHKSFIPQKLQTKLDQDEKYS